MAPALVFPISQSRCRWPSLLFLLPGWPMNTQGSHTSSFPVPLRDPVTQTPLGTASHCFLLPTATPLVPEWPPPGGRISPEPVCSVCVRSLFFHL